MGVLGAAAAGAPAAEAGAGAGLAWAIQAGALWRLVAALEAGRSATRPWVAGMAARLAGLALVAAVAWGTGLEAEPMAVAYVGAVIPLLWVEGLWLNRAAVEGDGPESPETRATNERTDCT